LATPQRWLLFHSSISWAILQPFSPFVEMERWLGSLPEAKHVTGDPDDGDPSCRGTESGVAFAGAGAVLAAARQRSLRCEPTTRPHPWWPRWICRSWPLR